MFIKLNAVYMNSEFFKKIEELNYIEDPEMRASMLEGLDKKEYEVIGETSVNTKLIESVRPSILEEGRTIVCTGNNEYMVVGESESIISTVESISKEK